MSHSLGENSLCSTHTYISNLVSLSPPVYIHLLFYLVSLFDPFDSVPLLTNQTALKIIAPTMMVWSLKSSMTSLLLL